MKKESNDNSRTARRPRRTPTRSKAVLDTPVAAFVGSAQTEVAQEPTAKTTVENTLRTIIRFLLVIIASGGLTAFVDQFADVQSESMKVLIQSVWASVLLFARTYIEQKTGKGVLVAPPVTNATITASKNVEIGGA